ncbi:hypothetical protein HC723_13365 [Vibrio sp. S11_S32]|uniref:hypothetical protein n=1 Tax=Vibrio sp. S11_S32 TaxID=2720225 RepID=UPI00168186E6|nr:hypothetical protein [Vibrio sp. S11_S32]MBD1577412.1 hypothetical protein [Vibrio sp. S11_S32]
MYSEKKLASLICHEEIIMEGLDKDFWRLIKLVSPQRWEHIDETKELYSWVLALIGDHCIYFDSEKNVYVIAQFDDYWEINTEKGVYESLHQLITDIVRSRFKRP